MYSDAAYLAGPYNVTPSEFIEKWKGNPLGERQGAQSHFIDLCDLLGIDKPVDQENYCFEKGALKTGASHGWADVWKRGFFGWEYKGPSGDLSKALKQLMMYALALESPPLLVVSDRELVEVHTHFTGTPSDVYTFHIDQFTDPAVLQKLRWIFTDPDRFKPSKTIKEVTEEAASKFADLAITLADRGFEPQRVAHFLNKCLFAMFAEHVGLLNKQLFSRLLEAAEKNPSEFVPMIRDLFAAMQKGGRMGLDVIPWFNGGLFDSDDAIELNKTEIKMLLSVVGMDWSHIEPSIFGTLFERGLDPAKRAKLGAHYTDPGSIMRIINPVVSEPLSAEWAKIREQIAILAPGFGFLDWKKKTKPNKNLKTAYALFHGFVTRLRDFRVLDPACGSGNFLFLALKALKNLEHRVNLEAETFGLQRQLTIETCPANVIGIEINEYAAELTRVTVWIGEIQWMLDHGYAIRHDPILAKLDHIEHRDAVINPDNTEAEWPTCDVIIGNPPFLGAKRMRADLGDAYTDRLRACYGERVPGEADLVTFWFEKARAHIEYKHATAAGLVATNSIRQPGSRPILERIGCSGRIFHAWSDEPWINEGANVRVSIVCFDGKLPDGTGMLDGKPVAGINADLTENAVSKPDVTKAKSLATNVGKSFFGLLLAGEFAVHQDQAEQWLKESNPHGRPNSDVVRPILNGRDILGTPSKHWVIDFGTSMSEADASLYAAPFAQLDKFVKPVRLKNNRASRAKYWWRLGETRPGMRRAIAPLSRYCYGPK